MSLKKREDGKWLVNVTPGGRTGRQVKRVFKTQAEAKTFEIWIKANHQQDPDWTPAKRDTRRLKELISIWYGAHGQGLSAGPNTLARLNALADKMGNPAPAQLRERFDEYRQARIAEGKALGTINREHAYLRAVFNELRRLGHWQDENPIAEIRQFKTQERELSFLTHAQIRSLLEALEQSSNPHVLMITRIALATGGRWGECESIKTNQVHARRIQFAQTKSKKTRAVPISVDLAESIADHAHKHPTGTDRIFTSAYAAFLQGLERAQIKLPEGQATHVLRHTFASHFMINGGNILTLQRVLGHATLTMTMRYAHLAPDHLQEVLLLNPLETKFPGRTGSKPASEVRRNSTKKAPSEKSLSA